MSDRDDDTMTGIETAHERRSDSVREFAAVTLQKAAAGSDEERERAYAAVLANWRLEIQTHTRERVMAECARERRRLETQLEALREENARLRSRLGEMGR